MSQYEDPIWKNRSQEAQDLIKKMLDKNPDSRISATDAITSEWFSSAKDDEVKDGGKEILTNLQAFHVPSIFYSVSKQVKGCCVYLHCFSTIFQSR